MKELVLPKGLSRYTVSGDREIRITANQDAETLIEYIAEKDTEITWEIRVLSGVKATVFFLNRSSGKTSSDVRAEVTETAELRVGYLELGEAGGSVFARIRLTGSGAVSHFHTASLAKAPLDYDIETVHEADHTEGYMKNYGLAVKEVPWKIVCAGRIEKYARGSVSRQESRILTFEKPEMIKVLPILYIDENDVAASHANSIGQPDAAAMYYMESRGLSRKEVIGLLSTGYIIPVSEMFRDEGMRSFIRDTVTKKVKEWES